jgi:hypothetical protein
MHCASAYTFHGAHLTSLVDRKPHTDTHHTRQAKREGGRERERERERARRAKQAAASEDNQPEWSSGLPRETRSQISVLNETTNIHQASKLECPYNKTKRPK